MDEQLIRKAVEAAIDEVLHPTTDMSLRAAQRLSEKVRNKAKELGVKPVIAITNKAGHPILVECSDDSFIASYDIALNKAFTVVALKMSTKELSKLTKPGDSLYGIQFTNNGKIVIFGGGEPLRNKEGEIIGGIGVSGGSEEQDTQLAAFGKLVFEKGYKK